MKERTDEALDPSLESRTIFLEPSVETLEDVEGSNSEGGRFPAWALTLLTLAIVGGIFGWTFWKQYRADALWREAQQAIRAFEWDQAEQAFSNREWYANEQTEMSRQRLFVAIMRNDKDLVRKLLDKVPEFFSDLSSIYYSKGMISLRSSRLAEAEEALLKSLEFDPRNDVAVMGLLAIYSVLNRDDDYQKLAQSVISDSRSNPLKLVVLRLLAHGQPIAPRGPFGRRGEQSILSMAWELYPDAPYIRSSMAMTHLRDRELDKAKAVLELVENPATTEQEPPLDLELAWIECHLADKQTDKADQRLTQLNNRAKDMFWYWKLKAKIHAELGQTQPAFEAYREALRRQPGHRSVRTEFADLLEKQGNQAQAKIERDRIQQQTNLQNLAGLQASDELLPTTIDQAIVICNSLGYELESKAWTQARNQSNTLSQMLFGQNPSPSLGRSR